MEPFCFFCHFVGILNTFLVCFLGFQCGRINVPPPIKVPIYVYKGCTKKIVPFSKFESGLLTRTVCTRRLSFSQFGVLMSTLNCEKENLLGQTVLVKRPLSNFEKGTIFFVHPLFTLLLQ